MRAAHRTSITPRPSILDHPSALAVWFVAIVAVMIGALGVITTMMPAVIALPLVVGVIALAVLPMLPSDRRDALHEDAVSAGLGEHLSHRDPEFDDVVTLATFIDGEAAADFRRRHPQVKRDDTVGFAPGPLLPPALPASPRRLDVYA